MNLNVIRLVETFKKKIRTIIGIKNYKKFVIITDARRGSNLLNSLLNNHLNIKAHGEMFKRLDGRDWKEIWKVVFSRHSKQTKYVGFKIFYRHPFDDKEQLVWKHILDNKEIKIIHLKRRNLLRAYLSREIAFKTGIWYEKEKQKKIELKNKRIELKLKKCLREFKSTRVQEAKIQKDFFAHSFIEIDYEELAENTQGTMSKIFQFLDVPDKQVKSKLIKQNPEKLETLILNYNEFSKRLSKTKFADFLEEKKKANRLKKFIVLSYPRTGSTFFCGGVLSRHKSIKCYDEIFNNTFRTKKILKELNIEPYKGLTEKRSVHDFLKELIHQTKTNNEKLEAIGFKLFVGQIPTRAIIELMQDWEFIILRRYPIAQSAISYEIAKRTGQWGLQNKKELKEFSIRKRKVLEFCKKYSGALDELEIELIEHNKNYVSLEYRTLFQKQTLRKVEQWLKVEQQFNNFHFPKRKLNNAARYKKVLNIAEIEKETITKGYGYIFDRPA